jgi:hypothetical protein
VFLLCLAAACVIRSSISFSAKHGRDAQHGAPFASKYQSSSIEAAVVAPARLWVPIYPFPSWFLGESVAAVHHEPASPRWAASLTTSKPITSLPAFLHSTLQGKQIGHSPFLSFLRQPLIALLRNRTFKRALQTFGLARLLSGTPRRCKDLLPLTDFLRWNQGYFPSRGFLHPVEILLGLVRSSRRTYASGSF